MATAPNLGTGGSVLDAQFGSSSGSNTNEPLALAHTGTNYLYLPGVAGNYASVPDSAALDITGDIDIRVRCALEDWSGAARETFAEKWGNTSWAFTKDPAAGKLRLDWTESGLTQKAATSTTAMTFSSLQDKWVRVTLDVDNGAGGNTVSFYTSDDGATWTLLGTPVVQAGVTSLNVNSEQVEIGALNTNSLLLKGRVYRAQIRNGIDGTVVLDANFTTGITSGGQTSFVESSSNAATVTINRSTSGRKAVAVVRPVWLLGTDDFFEVADNDLLDFTNTQDLSAVAIVRAWGTTADDTLIAKKAGTTSASAGWMLDMGTSSVTQARISDGTTQHAPTAGTRTAGALSLLAAVKSGSTITSYLGSTAGTPVTITATGTYANSEVMRIGRLSGAGTNYADMELIAALVFRRALSATELSAIATYYGV